MKCKRIACLLMTFIFLFSMFPAAMITVKAAGGVWHTCSSQIATQHMTAVAYGGGNFAAFGDWGAILTSSDGGTWTENTPQVNTGAPYYGYTRSIAFGGRFVGIAPGLVVNSSADASAWNVYWRGDLTDPDYIRPYAAVTYGNGQYVAVGERAIATSSDGDNWTQDSYPDYNLMQGIAFGNGIFVVAAHDYLLTSADGQNWTNQNDSLDPDYYPLEHMIFGNGIFVNYGSGSYLGGKIFTSPDGVHWTEHAIPTTSQALNGMAYGNGVFVAVGDDGVLLTSTDNGATWFEGVSGTTKNLNGVAFGGGTFVAVGNDNTIIWSDSPVPAPISDFACTGKTDTTVSFSFSAPAGATSVKMQQSSNGGLAWADASAGALNAFSTTATVTGLAPGTSYQFKLVVNGGTSPGTSNIVGVATAASEPDELMITTDHLSAGAVGNSYSTTLTAGGGTAPYTWSANGLPTGLSIDTATGVISGTPVSAGTSAVTASVSDSDNHNASVSLNLIIYPTPISDFTCSGKTQTTANFSFTAPAGATAVKVRQSADGGTTWTDSTAGALTAASTTAAATGLIPGTTYKFKLIVTGGNCAGESNIVDVTTDAASPAPDLKWAPASGENNAIAGSIGHIAAGSGGIVAATNGSGKLIVSTDNGRTWSIKDTGTFKAEDIVYDGNSFVAVGNGIMSSTDGAVWAADTVTGVNWSNTSLYTVSSYGTSIGWVTVACGNHGLILVRNSGDTWQKLDLHNPNAVDVTFGHKFSYVPAHQVQINETTTANIAEEFIGFGSGMIIKVFHYSLSDPRFLSASSQSSTEIQSFTNVWYESIPEKFYATAPSGFPGKMNLFETAFLDFPSWSLIGSYGGIKSFASYGDIFVKVGGAGTILTSANGAAWTSQTVKTADLNDVVFADGVFVAVGNNGTILTSADGVSWHTCTSGTSNNLFHVEYIDGDFLASGDGIILRSGINVPTLVLKTVISPSTSGFAVTLGPPVPGLVKGDFTLTDGANPVIIDTVSTSNGGATYTVNAALEAGKTYTVDIFKPGFAFGIAKSFVVPAAPISDFTCTGKTETTAGFSFTAPAGATAVKVRHSTDGGTTWTDSTTEALTAASTTATAIGLTPNTSYKFKLTVTGGSFAGDSNIVDVAKVVTGIAVKTQPADLIYTAGENLDLTGLSVTLTYSDSSSLDVSCEDFSFMNITANPANGTAMAAAHNNLPVAVSCNGQTAYTNPLAVSPTVAPAAPISDFTCTGKTETTADFSFTAPTGATAVEVRHSTDGGMTWTDSTTETLTGASTTAAAIGLTPDTTYKFKLTVTGGSFAGDSNVIDVVTGPIPVQLSITTASLPPATTGQAYNTTLIASGGTEPYTWSAAGLPAGLNINALTGVISGIPGTPGTSSVTVTLSDSASKIASKSFSLTVNQAPSVTGGGGGTTSSMQIIYKAQMETGNGTKRTLPVMVDQASGTATIIAGSQSTPVPGGSVIKAPSIPGVDAYSILIPVPDLSTVYTQGIVTFDTDAGSITILTNMLTGVAGASGSNAKITIGQGNKSNLPDDVKAAIGDKPLIQLTLSIDGTQFDWNNPGTPVTVSIPYTPTAEELANPDSIIVWYIDGSGNAVSVPNGHYDPATGTVTFATTHFSDYAVGYNKVSFNDVAAGAWYNRPVSFIAARGITTGTGGGNFSPDAKLTRGQFIVMLMKAYGIPPDMNLTDNFADVGSTYYTGYLAVAKRLGISAGAGNNLFAPEKEITRQEMFTLLYNALKVIGQLPQGKRLPDGSPGRTLSDFTDAGQIDSWAKGAMTLLVEAGVIEGSGGMLTSASTTTRAEMAQVLYNLLSK